jgi:hypothetical protein
METISENQALLDDVWQKIPPEEKRHVVTEAQTSGISTVAILVMFSAAIAIGLRQPWYFWGSFALVPFLFQVASAKAWHIGKPRVIVEYTAARATAARASSSTHSRIRDGSQREVGPESPLCRTMPESGRQE